MSLHDFAKLFATLAVFWFGLVLVVLLAGNRPGGPNTWIFMDLLNPKERKHYVDDYKDPKIVAGGLLGLIRWFMILGVVSLMAAGVCWLLGVI